MATRTPGAPDPKKKPDAIAAAAFPLEVQSQDSLLYNSTVVDYLTNGIASGSTVLAWYYWGKIPELRYTTRYIANALSVATLYVGKGCGDGAPPKRLDEDHPAAQLLNSFAGGCSGQSEILDRLGLHLTVTGDSVLVGPRYGGVGSNPPPFDQWRVYSTEEVSSRNGKVFIKLPGNSKEMQIPDDVVAVRIWRPHPQKWYDADSPVKGAFSVLRELDLLDQHVHASAISRLAGAGILAIPEEIDLPGSDMEVDGTEIDYFVAMLTEIMGLAIKNRDSAAALVPIIIRGPAEFIDKIQHFDFSTEFSNQVPELRLGAIRRLALGMDVPPEVLLGSADSNSWSAWQTDESTLRVHLVPLLQLIASSLTVGWLRPALESLPLTDEEREEIQDLVVHFDVSNLKIRQDVSGDAQSLYDRMELDSDSLRLALGYGPDAAPDDEELAKIILFKLVQGTPEQANYAIKALRENFGIDLLPEPCDPCPEGGGGGAGPGAPSTMPKPESPTPSGPTPGQRSQDKQLSPPPPPAINGDQGNNSVGG